MLSNKEYLKKVLLFFVAIFFSTALGVGLASSWQIGLVFGFVLALFMSFHLGRTLKTETFEINASNKDKLKGLSWYEEEIIDEMRDLRWVLIENTKDVKVWIPRGQGRVMGGDFKMEVTPYSITITGTRGMVRVMKSILDLNKIFL